MEKTNSIVYRMNFNGEPESIIMLEDSGIYDISKIEEKFDLQKEIDALFSIIRVKYYDKCEIKEKICSINDLKENFYFIKIINYNNDKGKRDINFLASNKNKQYSSDGILSKMNNKVKFGNIIKEILNIDEFPIKKYFLKEENKYNFYPYYDKIYILKKINLFNTSFDRENDEKLNNSINNNNNNESNSIEKEVYIYCKSKNTYLCMTEQGKIEQHLKRYKWNVTINKNDKTIIFFSNNFYLIEDNGNVLGDKKNKEKWFYDKIEEDNYYFMCSKMRLLLSAEKKEIKANKNPPPKDNEIFQLYEVANNNHSWISSNLNDNITDIYTSVSI